MKIDPKSIKWEPCQCTEGCQSEVAEVGQYTAVVHDREWLIEIKNSAHCMYSGISISHEESKDKALQLIGLLLNEQPVEKPVLPPSWVDTFIKHVVFISLMTGLGIFVGAGAIFMMLRDTRCPECQAWVVPYAHQSKR